MEIRNDLSSRVLSRSDNVVLRSQSQAVQKSSQPIMPSPGFSSAQRNLANAMTLMQTASGIVQEALYVSSQLRSIAMVSMATGQTNQNEVAQTMAGIKTSLQQYGSPISVPSVQQSGEVISYGMPDISQELDTMEKMIRGNRIDEKDLSPMEKSLLSKQSDVFGKLEKLVERMGFTGQKIESASSFAGLPQAIQDNYGTALSAQGNIRNENVSALL